MIVATLAFPIDSFLRPLDVFADGEHGRNQYGDDPKGRIGRKKVFRMKINSEDL